MRTLALAAMVLGLSAFGFSQQAHAHSYHTKNFCSPTAPDICAHFGAEGEPTTQKTNEFMLHFMPKNASINTKLVTNIVVQTWMDMGRHSHPGGPEIRPATTNSVHYPLKDLSFSMEGDWQLKVAFDYNGAKHQLVIPFKVVK